MRIDLKRSARTCAAGHGLAIASRFGQPRPALLGMREKEHQGEQETRSPCTATKRGIFSRRHFLAAEIDSMELPLRTIRHYAPGRSKRLRVS